MDEQRSKGRKKDFVNYISLLARINSNYRDVRTVAS